MDHAYIEQNNIADLYVMGKLSPRQQGLFEQHFINCAECVELLEEIQTVWQALRVANPEEAIQPAIGFKSRLLSIFSRSNSRWQAISFGLAVLLLIVLPVGILIKEIRRLNRELDYIKSSYVPAPEQGQNQIGANSGGKEEYRVANQSLADQHQRGTEPSSKKQPRRIATPDHTGKLAQPQANIPIFVLSTVSRTGHRTPEPINEVIIDRSMKLVVFSVELETEQYERYRAVALTSDKQAFWRVNNLRPSRYGALTIGLSSKYFEEGNYLLVLEGLTREGQSVLVSSYPFRVIMKKPEKN